MTDCADPGQVANAARAGPTSLTPGATVIYTCNAGYQVVGDNGQVSTSAQITCQVSGQWTTLPVCTPIPTNQGKILDLETYSLDHY